MTIQNDYPQPQFFSTKKTEAGFIALISAILISISLLILVVAVGFEGYFSRFSVLESDQKERSVYLAEACVQTAILKLSQNSNYSGNETITVGTETCEIKLVTNGVSPDERIIKVQGVNNRAYTNLRVEIDITNPADVLIKSWVEVANI